MDKRRPGRPMDPEKSRRIEAATWQLLANEGYHALTFEAIAAKVGCNRPTIYRRYTSKVHLVASVLRNTLLSLAPPDEQKMTPREALRDLVKIGVTYLSGARGSALLNVASVARTSPEIAQALDAHLAGITPYYFAQLRRLAPDAPEGHLNFVMHTLIGGFMYHLTFRRVSLTPAQIDSLVDQAIALVTRPPAA